MPTLALQAARPAVLRVKAGQPFLKVVGAPPAAPGMIITLQYQHFVLTARSEPSSDSSTCSYNVSSAVTESMALEASARVAVTNAIENKEDLGGMLGTTPSQHMQSMVAFVHISTGLTPLYTCLHCVMSEGRLPSCSSDTTCQHKHHKTLFFKACD